MKGADTTSKEGRLTKKQLMSILKASADNVGVEVRDAQGHDLPIKRAAWRSGNDGLGVVVVLFPMGTHVPSLSEGYRSLVDWDDPET